MSDELVEVEIFGEKMRVAKGFAESQGLPFKTKRGRKALRLNWDLLVSGAVVATPCVAAVFYWLWILTSI